MTTILPVPAGAASCRCARPRVAGAYGVWLRRTGTKWRFVFNHEPDSWGTQHDPAVDAAKIPVEYSRAADAFRPFGTTLVPTGDDRAASSCTGAPTSGPPTSPS